MTGNRVAHPLLLSLANIHRDACMKASNKPFILLALLPIPKFKFLQKNLNGPLKNRVIHHCLDHICRLLKIAAKVGKLLTDGCGDV